MRGHSTGTGISDEKLATFLEALAEGCSLTEAARVAYISRTTATAILRDLPPQPSRPSTAG